MTFISPSTMAPFLFLAVIFCTIVVSPAQAEDLCSLQGCGCAQSESGANFIDISCNCPVGVESLSIGPPDVELSDQKVASAPAETAKITIYDCGQVEFLSKTFNSLANLRDINVTNVGKVVLHSRLFDARSETRQSVTLNNMEINKVPDLVVKRQAFEGVRVDGTFMLKSVIMTRTPSLAFAFDYINDFTAMKSNFARVSMWGFKIEECGEFNVLGNSRFYSLARQAIHLKCNKFMLAYNTFGNLQDSAISVRFGLADIQGNTFEKLAGKPFVNLRPMGKQDLTTMVGGQVGLVFRENKFASEPTLPFNALAMPAYDALSSTPAAHVDIDSNHFACACDKISWLLGAMIYGHDSDAIANGGGSLDFLRKVYDSAGQCLQCGLRECAVAGSKFADFAATALRADKGQLRCADSGQPLKSQETGQVFSVPPTDDNDVGEKTSAGRRAHLPASALVAASSVLVTIYTLS